MLRIALLAPACAAAPQRLIRLHPAQPPQWMTWEEAAQRVGGVGQMRRWQDVTDFQNATARFGPVPMAIPTEAHHQAFVRGVIARFVPEDLWATIRHLSEYHSRFASTDDGVEAVRWLAEQYRAAVPRSRRADVTIEEFATPAFRQPSLIVKVRGHGAAGEHVILGGHIDSTGALPVPGLRAPGADDDASGSATVLHAFRALMAGGFRPARTVEFQAYAAEEVGLIGSQAIANHYAAEQVKVAGMMQLDMTGYPSNSGQPATIRIYDDPTWMPTLSPTDHELNEHVRMLVDTYCATPWANSACVYQCSDHASWHSAGYRTTFPNEAYFTDHNPHIHSGEDTLDKLNITHATEFAKLAIAFAAEMGCDPSVEACT